MTTNTLAVTSARRTLLAKFSDFISEIEDGIPFLIIGGSSLLVVWLLSLLHGHLVAQKVLTDNWVNIGDEIFKPLFKLSFAIIALGIIAGVIGRTGRKVWKLFEPQISGQLTELKTSVLTELKTSKLGVVVDGADAREAEDMLIRLMGRAYGPHCLADNSLPNDVLSRYSKYFFSDHPFADNHVRIITVTQDGASGIKSWNEVTTYSIRCTSLEGSTSASKRPAKNFPLRYASEAEVDASKGWVKDQYVVKIKVGNDTVFDSDKDIERDDSGNPKSKTDFCRVSIDGTILKITFEKEIDVKKEKVDVTVTEKSSIAPDDDTITLHYPYPIFTGSFSINLPAGWSFVDTFFNNYGLRPSEVGVWEVTNLPSHVLFAKSSRWIPAGQCCVVRYKRPQKTPA